MSPARARSNAAAIAEGHPRSRGGRGRGVCRLLPPQRAISSRIDSRSSPRGSSSVAITRRGPLAGDPAHHGRFSTSSPLPTRNTAMSAPARRGHGGEDLEYGLERRRAVGVVDDHAETAGPHRCAPSDPGTPRRSSPARTAADQGQGLTERYDREALWTLNRPASWSWRLPGPDGACRRRGVRASPPRCEWARTSAAGPYRTWTMLRARLLGGRRRTGPAGRIVA